MTVPTTLISEKRKLTRVGQGIRGDDIGRLLRAEIASEDIPSACHPNSCERNNGCFKAVDRVARRYFLSPCMLFPTCGMRFSRKSRELPARTKLRSR